MKIIIILIISLTSYKWWYANTINSNLDTAVAPVVDINELRPDLNDLENISRLSEKYIMWAITEDELSELESLNWDFESLDVYKSEFEKSLQNNTNNTATIDNSALDKQVETVNTVQSWWQVKDEKKSSFSLFAVLIWAFTIINFILLMYVIISQRRK